MTKVGNWKSRKTRKQDMARRVHCRPSEQAALPRPVPPVLSWLAKIFIGFWILVAIAIVVIVRSLL